MKQRSKWEIALVPCLFILCLIENAACALEIRIPSITTRPNQTIDVPIIVDEVDNLAGVKLVISYDHEIFAFRKGAKTKQTDSLMHVVNDKKPGQLIVVMAGARGIKGKDVHIFTLTFDVKPGLEGNHVTKIGITEAQLMSDQLKEIKCTVAVDPITIAP
jgi:hypothetical protein